MPRLFRPRRLDPPTETIETAPPPPPQPDGIHHRDCGLIDDCLSGWYNRTTGELVPGFHINPDDVVVDVGAGGGGSSLFAANCGAEVFATDIDAARMDSLRERLATTPARAFRCLVSDSRPLPLPAAVATKVISTEVIEHVEDPVQFVAELVRVGKPGAHYLVSVPDPGVESVLQHVAAPGYWQPPNHIRIVGHEEFERLLRDAGLVIESRFHSGFFWSLWWTFFWACQEQGEAENDPLLRTWTKTWHLLISRPEGLHIKRALDQFMPKSQVLLARKPA